MISEEQMMPMESITESIAKNTQVLFTDIDDTITLDGKLLPDAYSSLWKLHKAGIKVIPVTGRPSGWCDHIARMWPVDGVVGENGALYFYMGKQKLEKVYYYKPSEAEGFRERLLTIRDDVLKQFPQLAVASDQPYREFDLAIDFCEDVPPQSWEVIDELVKIFHSHGAKTKISSIHVNGWFGDYDKLIMCKRYAVERLKLSEEELLLQSFFVGDSANDEPMFKFFNHSVGVSNINLFVDRMEYLPRYVCSRPGSHGFSDFVAHLLSRRT